MLWSSGLSVRQATSSLETVEMCWIGDTFLPLGLIRSILTSVGWFLSRSECGRGLWPTYPSLYVFILNIYRTRAWLRHRSETRVHSRVYLGVPPSPSLTKTEGNEAGMLILHGNHRKHYLRD